MLLFVGVLLLALGLLSGAALVLASFGLLAANTGFTLWVTFPLLCLLGFSFVAAQAGPALVRTVSLVASGLMLALALASITALVLGAASLSPAPASPAPLWFVLVVGVSLGSIGAASFGRRSDA
jgi:hypothetical protein